MRRDETAVSGDGRERIGPYRVLRSLGDGGLGRIYLAQQDAPHNEVAIRVLRFGHGSEDDRLQFRAEVERLGTLNHPGIARIYGAGQIGAGLAGTPYLVMEAVHGRRLPDWARECQPDTDARLRLIAKLARAVHYGHTRGFVHRDLRPSRIYIDDAGHAKILGFGVVAMFGADDVARLGHLHRLAAALPYLSPEQLGDDKTRVDPHSDVYALGVIAYELLSGHLPYPSPQPPTAEAAAQQRDNEPAPLSAQLPSAHGDLDAILRKALAVDVAARYGSAHELAVDIERYLHRQPVEAQPTTAGYLLRLFYRRHRRLSVGALAGIALLGMLALGASLAAWRLQAARTAAEQRATRLAASEDFLETALLAGGPQSREGQAVTLRQILDRARLRLDGDHGLAPAPRADVARALGAAYAQLGDRADADALFDRAQQTIGADSGAQQSLQLARAVAELQNGDPDAALQTLHALLAAEPPEDAAAQRRWVQAGEVAISAEHAQHRSGAALQRAVALAATAQRLLGADDVDTLAVELDRAELLQAAGRQAESRTLAAALLPRFDAQLGALHPYTLMLKHTQALNLRSLGDRDGATALMATVAAGREQLLGPAHADTLAAQAAYAELLMDGGHYAEADPLLSELVVRAAASFGQNDPRIPVYAARYGECLAGERRTAEARAVLQAAYARALTLDGVPADALQRMRTQLDRIDSAPATPVCTDGACTDTQPTR